MNFEELKSVQSPIKNNYRNSPETALFKLKAEGELGQGATCSVETGQALIKAGLHPGTGGDGLSICSGDMLLQALVTCAGVTLGVVAASRDIKIKSGKVKAVGEIDFRGTLGVSKDVPVGFQKINLTFSLVTDAPEEQLDKLIKLTEKYCVVYQTLIKGVKTEVKLDR
jgi:uncharacterized OsmC-like protein